MSTPRRIHWAIARFEFQSLAGPRSGDTLTVHIDSSLTPELAEEVMDCVAKAMQGCELPLAEFVTLFATAAP